MIEIYVPDINDSVGKIGIEGKEMFIRFTINPKFDYWSFGLYKGNREPILPMVKIVPNAPLTHYYRENGVPKGVFWCFSGQDRIGREDFKNNKAQFVYIPLNELAEVASWQTG